MFTTIVILYFLANAWDQYNKQRTGSVMRSYPAVVYAMLGSYYLHQGELIVSLIWFSSSVIMTWMWITDERGL